MGGGGWFPGIGILPYDHGMSRSCDVVVLVDGLLVYFFLHKISSLKAKMQGAGFSDSEVGSCCQIYCNELRDFFSSFETVTCFTCDKGSQML